MENYAENLLPNNQVERVQALANLSNRTFLVTYTNEIDRELLMDRFSKRSAKMKLFESFRTNTFIIKSSNQNAPITSTQMTTLREEIESKLTKKIFIYFSKVLLMCNEMNQKIYQVILLIFIKLDPQYITSSNSSSLESIKNVPTQYGNDIYMINEPPGFSKYRIGAIQG